MSAKFDFHVHTTYSDGSSPATLMIEAAESRGLEGVAITDHGPELSVGIKRDAIAMAIDDVISAKSDARVPVLTGFEANVVNDEGELDITSEVTDRLDILLIGIHYLGSKAAPTGIAQSYLRRATCALEKNPVDVMAHPFFLHQSLLPNISKQDIEEFVDLAAIKEVAMEINVKYGAPDFGFVQLCLSKGVKFSIGSDAHNPASVGRIDWALSVLRKAGAKREDLVLDKYL